MKTQTLMVFVAIGFFVPLLIWGMGVLLLLALDWIAGKLR